MEAPDRLGQAFDAEILGACPSIERVHSEVHRVGACADRRLERELVAAGARTSGRIGLSDIVKTIANT